MGGGATPFGQRGRRSSRSGCGAREPSMKSAAGGELRRGPRDGSWKFLRARRLRCLPMLVVAACNEQDMADRRVMDGGRLLFDCAIVFASTIPTPYNAQVRDCRIAGSRDARCGEITVPENYQRPSGRQSTGILSCGGRCSGRRRDRPAISTLPAAPASPDSDAAIFSHGTGATLRHTEDVVRLGSA